MQTDNSSSFLKFESISKTFNRDSVNEARVFDNFSLTIRKHEFVSIVGSNGSGKTTILNLLCGSFPLDGGKIVLDGNDITALKEYQRAAFIGRVFQAPDKGTCPSLTILENMSLADNKSKRFGLTMSVDRKRSDYYRQKLELLHLGLENRIEQPVGTLSGGQRQALALLMCTMTPIELLVLDEHTAALDPASSENVMQLTEALVSESKITTLMVTHNLRHAVEHGNRLVMMHAGTAVVDFDGEKKQSTKVSDLLKVFNEISVECGN